MKFVAQIPVEVHCPEPMNAPVQYVFAGEYESHYSGTNLTILDIGGNVGAFSLWANLRWPGSRIEAYEPNPGTFAFFQRNTAGISAIVGHNAALFPGAAKRAAFFSRYDGDGEAGLTSYATDTFRAAVVVPKFEVDVVDPASLKSADIVKIDIEGGEGDVLAALDLSATSLVLLEFQNRRNRLAMQARLAATGFDKLIDEECPWDPILDYRDYNQDLRGDIYGRMFYLKRGQTKLTHAPVDPST
jgi:FkbM family methyltransferase